MKIAVFSANGLGDGLMIMVLSHNFSLSGHTTTTFSNALFELKNWFPNQNILPFPPVEKYQKTFSAFDQIICGDSTLLYTAPHIFGDELISLQNEPLNKNHTLVQNFATLCRTRFGLPHSHQNNGIVSPSELQYQRFPRRIIIHPMSVEEKRIWPADKFISLAQKLQKKGWEPVICVSPKERELWLPRVETLSCPLFPSLNDLAAFVYESAACIGNNSGTGHLASNFGLPTLSLFSKKSYAKLWRPGWGPNRFVTPPLFLISGGLKLRHWKKFLSVSRAQKNFEKLMTQFAPNGRVNCNFYQNSSNN